MSSGFEKFEELQKEGKRLAAEGKLYESLHRFELARKIKETSKILHRIQKLKDAIGQNEKKEPVRKCEQSFSQKSSRHTDNSEKVSGILNQIQNIEVQHENPAKLSSEILKKFNDLKSKGIVLSYEGKMDEALHCFSEARKLCDCPKVEKYIQELQTLISKYPKKLEKFQNLTDTGKKLASAGKQTESLEKLKNAFAVCPSPTVSRMIKKIQANSSSPEDAVFLSSDFKEHLSIKNTDKDVEILPRDTVFSSSDSKENHLSFPDLKNDSNGSEFSLPSGNETDCVNQADPSPETKELLKKLYKQAKEHAAAGQLQKALDSLEEAKKIYPSEKILKRIKDLKEHMNESDAEISSDMIEVKNGFFVFHEIYNKLYPYQREGVAWMWSLFKMKKGGVLGDDMGLGKTFQVIAFLSGLIDADLIKHALIIMPVSLLPNWEREFRKWCPGISVSLFHGGSKKERERNLLRVQRRGNVLLTSYGMVLNAIALLKDFDGKPFVWDYVILDEGHKIKNPTKTTKAVHAIPSKNRLVLTGTPVQNNLLELWALYDFAHQGTLLGSLKTFKMQYENTITRAREKDSSAGEKRLGTEMAENLKMLIKPYFLRRTKAEIWSNKTDTSDEISDLSKHMGQLRLSENKVNTRKNDLIVWTFMSEAQCEIYRSFLHSEAVKTILVSKRSPLVELTTLKKICDHPRLLSQRACLQLGLNGDLDEEELQRELDNESTYSSSIENVTDETLMAESGKMKFLIQLLENLKIEGHRTLVFSLSRKILDMINRILINRHWKVLRIDGTISKIEERERRIQLFQRDSSYSVFLLTTQVGGVGITLTAADRVVIYDPSWNPATDAQAVDRVYRIGQKKNVIVYRLVTCGTVEEKIYRRQIFKDSITKQATCSSDPYRYFSKQELRELFTFEHPHHSATQVQLSELHSHQRLSDTQLDAHLAFLHSLDIFGISDHDLMFSREIEDEAEDNETAAISHDYIKKQVAAAQVLIQTEASVVEEGIRLAGTFSRPFSEHIPVSKNSKTAVQMFKAASSSTSSYSLLMNQQSGRDFASNNPSNIISNASVPLRKNSGDHCSYVSKYTSHTEDDRNETKPMNGSIHLTKIDNHDFVASEQVSIIELSSDDEDRNRQISPTCELFPPVSANNNEINVSSIAISDAVTPPLGKRIGDNYRYISKCVSPSSSNKDILHKDSIHITEMLSNNLDIQNCTIELNINNEERIGQNSQRIQFSNETMQNLEQITNIESKSYVQSEHHSICDDEGKNENADPALFNTEATDHNGLAKFCESPIIPPLTESELFQGKIDSSINRKPNSTPPTSDNELSYSDFQHFLSRQKVIKKNNNLSENLETTINLNGSNLAHRTSGFASTETTPPSENRCLSVNLGSASPLDVSASDSMEDISFDDKPCITKRKSCALAKPFLASDSDSSCQSSPSMEDPGVFLASTDSEDDPEENDVTNSSISFVPSSIPNSPAPRNKTFYGRAEESPVTRRITPLKVRKSLCPPPDRAFAKALASSPIIPLPAYSSDSEIDSPVHMHKKKSRKNIIQSSDEEM